MIKSLCLSEQVLLLALVYRQETHVSALAAVCPVQNELSVRAGADGAGPAFALLRAGGPSEH